MRRSTSRRTLFVLVSGLAASASAAQASTNLAIDPARSNLSVTLTISGSSATDSSPVTGFFLVDLNSPSGPTQIGLRDFQINVSETLTLNISFGFLGRFNSTASNVSVRYANPGTLFGPVPITATNFEFTGVPSTTSGTLNYSATGIVCTLLQGSQLPCTGNINLADQGEQSADSVGGTLTVANRVATLTGAIDVTSPIDPDNPGIGTIRVNGSIVAAGSVRCEADFNNDGQVDFFDYLDFVNAFGNDEVAADFNADGQVDFFDYLDFASAFAAPCE
ncbi:MAG: hypothetical protein SFZ23_13000 [Planctomycetota bacterium]|nr:hypothetical protein [Planctomycetota bacterium]